MWHCMGLNSHVEPKKKNTWNWIKNDECTLTLLEACHDMLPIDQQTEFVVVCRSHRWRRQRNIHRLAAAPVEAALGQASLCAAASVIRSIWIGTNITTLGRWVFKAEKISLEKRPKIPNQIEVAKFFLRSIMHINQNHIGMFIFVTAIHRKYITRKDVAIYWREL